MFLTLIIFSCDIISYYFDCKVNPPKLIIIPEPTLLLLGTPPWQGEQIWPFFFTDRPLPLPLTHACKSPLLQLPADCFNNQQHQRTLLNNGICTMHHGMILSPSLLPTLSSHTISQDHIIEATPGCRHLTSTTTAGSLHPISFKAAMGFTGDGAEARRR